MKRWEFGLGFFGRQAQAGIKRNEDSRGLGTPDLASMILPMAVLFGLLTGLGEVVGLAFATRFMHRYVSFFGPHLIWMSPLADVLFFIFVGLVLSVLGGRWASVRSLRVVSFVFAFLSCVSLFFLVVLLHPLAALALAAGLAWQSSYVIAKHPNRSWSLLRHTTAWVPLPGRLGKPRPPRGLLVAADTEYLICRRQFLLSSGATMAGLALGVNGWQALGEAFTTSGARAASANIPNVLLVVLDTVRSASLSLYGYQRPTTPNLQRIAKAGVCFERAFSTAPWTLPSHASMFTGRYAHELSANWQAPLDATYPTLAEILSDRGYATAGFVANNLFCSRASGLDRGFAHYEDFTLSPGQIIYSSSLGRMIAGQEVVIRTVGYYDDLGRKSASELSNNFLSWLSRRGRHQPFFAFLNYYDAHSPYLPPAPFDRLFQPQRPRSDPRMHIPREWSAQEIEAQQDAYEGSIAYLDHHLGTLFGELEAQGLLDNTLVIITSDHGEEFGEHGVMIHGHSTYLRSIHVPLIISFHSRIPSGVGIAEPVTLRDLPATIVDLLGLNNQGRIPGNSLVQRWANTSRGSNQSSALLSELSTIGIQLPNWYPVGKGDMKSLVAEQYHYIKNGDGREELYNFANDPLEALELAGRADFRAILERFRESLEVVLSTRSV